MKSNHSTVDKKEDDDMPMEDILASIRRYVSEEPNSEKTTEEFFDENQREKTLDYTNTIRLTKEQEISDPSSKTIARKKEDQSLLSKETQRLSAMAFDKLKKVSEKTIETKKEERKILEESTTLDTFVRDTVEKYVQIWLDEHLPGIVEEMIAQEIEKIKNPSL